MAFFLIVTILVFRRVVFYLNIDNEHLSKGKYDLGTFAAQIGNSKTLLAMMHLAAVRLAANYFLNIFYLSDNFSFL